MKKYLVFSIWVLLGHAWSQPRVLSVDSVRFQAAGPAGLKINGTTQALSLTAAGDFYLLQVPLDTVTTGISLRDRHMKEKYLQTQSFPLAELKFPKSALKEGRGQKTNAQLKVHGVEKTVDVIYDVIRTGEPLQVEGAFHVNINDHGIDVPNYLGITVKPDVKVTAKFEVTPS